MLLSLSRSRSFVWRLLSQLSTMLEILWLVDKLIDYCFCVSIRRNSRVFGWRDKRFHSSHFLSFNWTISFTCKETICSWVMSVLIFYERRKSLSWVWIYSFATDSFMKLKWLFQILRGVFRSEKSWFLINCRLFSTILKWSRPRVLLWLTYHLMVVLDCVSLFTWRRAIISVSFSFPLIFRSGVLDIVIRE